MAPLQGPAARAPGGPGQKSRPRGSLISTPRPRHAQRSPPFRRRRLPGRASGPRNLLTGPPLNLLTGPPLNLLTGPPQDPETGAGPGRLWLRAGVHRWMGLLGAHASELQAPLLSPTAPLL